MRRTGIGMAFAAIFVSLIASGCLSGRGREELGQVRQIGKAEPISEGDARVLLKAGIAPANYRMSLGKFDGDDMRTYYHAPGESPEELERLGAKVHAQVEALAVRLPGLSLTDLVTSFGSPTRLEVVATPDRTFFNAYYAEVHFFFLENGDAVDEIRFEADQGTYSPASQYRYRQSIGVGSTKAEVFAMLGEPRATVRFQEWPDLGDGVLQVSDSNVGLEHIAYVSRGIRFFFWDGAVSAMYFFKPGAGLAKPARSDGEGEPAPSGAAPEKDSRILGEAGISAAKYSLAARGAGASEVRTYYHAPAEGPEELDAIVERVEASMEEFSASLPSLSLRELAAKLGAPTRIEIAEKPDGREIKASYGDIVFVFDGSAEKASEIVFRDINGYHYLPEQKFRFMGRIRVDTPLKDVISLLGQPDSREGSSIAYNKAGVRFAIGEGAVTEIHIVPRGAGASGANPTIKPYADVRLTPFDAMAGLVSIPVNAPDDLGLIRTLWLNDSATFSGPSAKLAARVIEEGRNPGLGVRALHASGITGEGVLVGIIDQNLPGLDHPEYAGKVEKYKDFGTGQAADQGSMHGPAVLSLLVGERAGTSPGARVFFAAVPSWNGDAKYYADALNWMVDESAKLAKGKGIRVVSVSAAPSGKGSPFSMNGAAWDQAFAKATAAGILVLDCTEEKGLIGPCYFSLEDRENPRVCKAGFPGVPYSGITTRDPLRAPTSYRSTAEAYMTGSKAWQYTGRGGLSWGIPWAAGVLALGWQVDPSLGPKAIMGLMEASAYRSYDGEKIIDPASFIEAVRAGRR